MSLQYDMDKEPVDEKGAFRDPLKEMFLVFLDGYNQNILM